MLTPEQIDSVRNVISICRRNHERVVCSLVNHISDYEPQSRVMPSQFLEGYLSQVSSALGDYEKKLKEETIRVTRVVCPVLTENEKERMLEVVETALNEDFYMKRFKITCESLVRHFSRYGINISLSGYRVNLIESKHTVLIRNKLREIKQAINVEVSLLVSPAQTPEVKSDGNRWEKALELKPNFFGIGINLNYVISWLRGRKG